VDDKLLPHLFFQLFLVKKDAKIMANYLRRSAWMTISSELWEDPSAGFEKCLTDFFKF